MERQEQVGKGRQQANDSIRRLLRIKATSDLDVTAIRVVADERESQRRIKEEQQRQVHAWHALELPCCPTATARQSPQQCAAACQLGAQTQTFASCTPERSAWQAAAPVLML